MRTIIVVAYQLHFSKGSEYATAWNYVTNLCKSNKVFVLYGTSGGHHELGNTAEMEEYIKSNPISNLYLIPVKPTFKPIVYGEGIFGTYLFYNEYKKWHKDVLSVVKDLLKKEKVEIIHYHGPIGFREPGYLMTLDVPYIWGPIGGFDGVKLPLITSSQTLKGIITQFLKHIVNKYQQRFNRRVKDAIKKSDVVIGATTEYLDAMQKIAGPIHHSKLIYLPESCVMDLHDLDYSKFNDYKLIRLLWASRVDSQKGLILLLKALKKLPYNTPIHLDVAHTGLLEESSIKWAIKNGIDHFISWKGKVDKTELERLYNKSHLHVMTSLVDANTMVMWETMSYGLPTLSLDHCGMHDTVTEKSGFKVKVSDVETITTDIANCILNIVHQPSLLKDAAEEVLKERLKYTREAHMKSLKDIFELAINNHNKQIK